MINLDWLNRLSPRHAEMLREAARSSLPSVDEEAGEHGAPLGGTADFVNPFADIEREAQALAARIEVLESRRRARLAGYTDEGLAKLESFMRQAGVTDHVAAMPEFEKLHPQPEPVASSGQSFRTLMSHPKEQDRAANERAMERLMSGDDEGFLAQSIPLALRGARGG